MPILINLDRRRGGDRRSRPTPWISRYWLRGRRRGDRRKAHRGREYVDRYTFEGRPGQQLHVEVNSNDFDTYVIVAGPGEDRGENDDAVGSNSALDMDLTESGTYEVTSTS